MIKVAVSGAAGRLGSAIANGVAGADDMTLSAGYSPHHGGTVVAGVTMTDDPRGFEADVVVECTHNDVVMDNLQIWSDRGVSAVVGTSGFTADRLDELRKLWGTTGPGCLVVPNFSIGAVLMMRVAEMAAPLFRSAEVIERHHPDKPDAPSGTALATAMRMGAAGAGSSDISKEIVGGARGGDVSGVRVHSLRLDGVLSDQEVAFANPGEQFSVLHRSTSYGSFVSGALVAIRHVTSISGVAVGLDAALGI